MFLSESRDVNLATVVDATVHYVSSSVYDTWASDDGSKKGGSPVTRNFSGRHPTTDTSCGARSSATARSGDPRRFIVFEYRADDAYQLADRVFADSGRIVSGRRCGRVRCEAGLWALPRRGLGEELYGGAWRQIGSAVEL
jgi:hypothetical protein